MKAVLAIWALMAEPSVAAEDFDWRTGATRATIAQAFDRLATVCAHDYGFTRVPAKPEAAMRDKIKAHLLLATDSTRVLDHWADILERSKLPEAGQNNARAERMADAVEAAQKDASTYARGEGLFVGQLTEMLDVAVEACRDATRDEFLGANYLSGKGSSESYAAQAKQEFADQVADRE